MLFIVETKQERKYIDFFFKFIFMVLTPAQVIYEALCFDVAQGRMNGAPNETRTHLCRFARPAC